MHFFYKLTTWYIENLLKVNKSLPPPVVQSCATYIYHIKKETDICRRCITTYPTVIAAGGIVVKEANTLNYLHAIR